MPKPSSRRSLVADEVATPAVLDSLPTFERHACVGFYYCGSATDSASARERR